jgi:UDP-2-acetamido-3-amino-2,3-dideoxy-glucuronate N-acetyltransferase
LVFRADERGFTNPSKVVLNLDLGAMEQPNPESSSESAYVVASATIGHGVRIWRFCQVLDEAVIGERSVIGHCCFVGEKVVIGARCRLQSNVSLFEGVELEDDVFVGPHVTFTNVREPRAFVSRRDEFERTLVRRGATIGANATILPGVEIGEYSFVAAGAVVTKNVRPFELVMGVPARGVGWVSRLGRRLDPDENGRCSCPESGETYVLDESGLSLLS